MTKEQTATGTIDRSASNVVLRNANRGLPRGGSKPSLKPRAKRLSWTFFEDAPRPHRVRVFLEPEPEGGYSATCPDLPGAISQGATEAEAIGRIGDAVAGLIRAYADEGQDVPWTCDEIPAPDGVLESRIVVSA